VTPTLPLHGVARGRPRAALRLRLCRGDLLLDAEPRGELGDQRMQVERDGALVGGHHAATAVDDVHQLGVRPAVGRLPSILHL
jgi:hypothetical protein